MCRPRSKTKYVKVHLGICSYHISTIKFRLWDSARQPISVYTASTFQKSHVDIWVIFGAADKDKNFTQLINSKVFFCLPEELETDQSIKK